MLSGFFRLKFLKSLFWTSFAGIFVFLVLVWFSLPNVSSLKDQYPVVLYQGPRQPPKVIFQKSRPRAWTGLRGISKLAIGAVIVSEDSLFFQHKGFDLDQIRDALEDSIEAGRFVRGASTITQQMVRNVFLEKDRTLWRKLKEILLSIQIEQSLGKRKILEIYLNIAEWGDGIYGIGEASHHYFGKSPASLSAKEGAFLAMLLPSPKRYSLSFRVKRLTDYARSTVNAILEKMTLVHYLSREELEQERKRALPFEHFLSQDSIPAPNEI